MAPTHQGITVAVLLCAGQGTRMGVAQNKILLPLAGKPLLVYAIEAFARAPGVAEIVLVAHPREVDHITAAIVQPLGLPKPITVISGGASRHQSEYCALAMLRERILADQVTLVLLHDGARPLVAQDDIVRLLDAARVTGGALLATPVSPGERIVVRGDEATAGEDYPTAHLWRAQTPQAFAARPLLAAYEAAQVAGFEGTDTASSFERAGFAVRVVAGSPTNIKVTTPEDLVVAADLLRQIGGETSSTLTIGST